MNVAESRRSLDPDRLAGMLAEAGFTGPTPDLRGTTASTNADAAALDGPGVADFTCIQAEEQLAGRGRLARDWQSPAGAGLWCSTLVPTQGVPAAQRSWLPLAAGLAACDAIDGVPVALKWPNDLVVAEGPAVRKLGGILVELLPSGRAVVGIGINVGIDAAELPFPQATSLLSEGGDLDRTALLGRLLPALQWRWRQWRDDPEMLRADYLARCASIGRSVAVHLPDGAVFAGRAVGVDADGALLVDDGATTRSVTAADVVHATISA